MDDVATFLDAVDHPIRRAGAKRLDALFRDVTGFAPWLSPNGKMVGYGKYHYTYDSGHSGTTLATGFAPAKSNLTIYIMPGYLEMEEPLSRLGKHKKGKSCLYINKLADIDEDVLAEIIRLGLDDLATRWTIEAT